MTWAEITAWNRGRRLVLSGQWPRLWLMAAAAAPDQLLTPEERDARQRLGVERFESWVQKGAADVKAEHPAT